MLLLNKLKEYFMKIFITIIFLCFLTGALTSNFAQTQQDTLSEVNIDDPSGYLPDYLDNVHIGMPLADFENVKDTLSLDINATASDMWYGIREDVNDQGISEISYKFDKEENGINEDRPLYQINIVFLESDYENDFLTEKLGIPEKEMGQTENKWVFKTNKNYLLIVKKMDNEVQLITTMPGTEWDTNN
jgi:hypothetical protein